MFELPPRDRILRALKPSPVTLILLGLIAYVWFRPPAWVSDQSTDVPAFTVEPLSGPAYPFSALRGKVVLVNFWASWCPYCRHEMPAMQKFYNAYRSQGFEVLTFSADADAATAARYLAQHGYTFPTAMTGPKHSAAFGDVSRLPTSFIVDRQGRIRKRIVGQVHYARLEKLVAPLLRE